MTVEDLPRCGQLRRVVGWLPDGREHSGILNGGLFALVRSGAIASHPADMRIDPNLYERDVPGVMGWLSAQIGNALKKRVENLEHRERENPLYA